jgi:hypothetical protein
LAANVELERSGRGQFQLLPWHLPKISGVPVVIPTAHEQLKGGLEHWLDPQCLSNAG